MPIKTRGGIELQPKPMPEPGPEEPAPDKIVEPEPAEEPEPMDTSTPTNETKNVPRLNTFELEAKELESMLNSPSFAVSPKECRFSRRNLNLVPEEGYEVPWGDTCIVMDHPSMLYYEFRTGKSWYQRVLLMNKRSTHHLFEPAHYMSLGEVMAIELPIMVSFADEPARCILLAAFTSEGGQAWGIFGMSTGEWNESTVVKKPLHHATKLLGPPTNGLGQRQELSHATAFYAKCNKIHRAMPPDTKVTLAAMADNFIKSTDRGGTFERIFDGAEADLRAHASKLKGGKDVEADCIKQVAFTPPAPPSRPLNFTCPPLPRSTCP